MIGEIFVKSQPPPVEGEPIPEWFSSVAEKLTANVFFGTSATRPTLPIRSN